MLCRTEKEKSVSFMCKEGDQTSGSVSLLLLVNLVSAGVIL